MLFFQSFSMHSASSYNKQQRGVRLSATPSLPDSLTYPSSACCLLSKPGTAQVSGFPFPPLSLPTAQAPLSNLEGEAPGLSAPVPGRRSGALPSPAPRRTPRRGTGLRGSVNGGGGRAVSPPRAGAPAGDGLSCRLAPSRLASRGSRRAL